MKTKYIKNENGMVLAWVLVVLVLLSIISVSIMSVYSSDYGSSTYQANKSQAHYLARAGAEAIADYIVDNPASLSAVQIDNLVNSISSVSKSNQTKIDGTDNGYFEVKVEQSGNKVNIISTGTVGNVKETDTFVIEKSASMPSFANAVFSEGEIKLEGSSTITGNTTTNSTSTTNLITTGSSKISGTYIMGAGTPTNDANAVKDNPHIDIEPGAGKPEVAVLPQPIVNDPPVFKAFPSPTPVPSSDGSLTVGWSGGEVPSYTISATKNYNGGIEVKKPTLTINGPVSGNMTVESSNLTVSGIGEIQINHPGSGTLMILVDDKFTIGSGTKVYVNITGTGDVVFFANKFWVTQGFINVDRSSTGRLNIFAINEFVLSGSSKINDDGDDKDDVSIFFLNPSSNPINLAGSTKINAHLEIQKGNLTLAGSDAAKGDIIYGGETLNITGGSSSVAKIVYAPLAKVTLTGSASFSGSIICKSLYLTGSANITHADVTVDSDDPINNNFGTVSYKRVQWN